MRVGLGGIDGDALASLILLIGWHPRVIVLLSADLISKKSQKVK